MHSYDLTSPPSVKDQLYVMWHRTEYVPLFLTARQRTDQYVYPENGECSRKYCYDNINQLSLPNLSMQ
jgi:hypothetical protein